MEREKKQTIFGKLVTALIIVMVIFSSYGTFLSEVCAAVIDYNNQKTEAGDKKVDFDAYFKNGDEKLRNVAIDTNSENILYLNVSLEEGIIQNAKVTLNNPNFAVDYEELKNNSLVKSVNEAENSIELNQITENTEVPVKVRYKAGDTVNLTDLERDTELNFEGTYTDSKKSNKALSGKISVKVKWLSTVTGGLQTNIENYIEADGKSIVITNTTGTIKGNTLPMEQVEFLSNVPDINGVVPETVDITENGRKLAENEFTYDKENKTLLIRKENVPNENNEVNNLSGNIAYSIIYIYGTQFNLDKVNFAVNQNLKVKPYNLEETNISFQNNLEKEQSNQTTLLDVSSVDKITKGYLFWQKFETPFDVNMNAQIQYILPNRDIEIVERENDLTGDNVNLNIVNRTYYANTVISKAELTSVLGENGSLEIYDANTGNLVTIINKDTGADENGNINVTYNNVARIRILIKNPEKIGNIHINSSKRIISNHGIDNETLKAVNQLRLIFDINNMIYTNSVEKDISLYNTVTKATMELDKTEFDTTDDSERINMKINLNTQNMDYDLFKNPVLRVTFPSEFEVVNIEKVGITFENGLQLTNAEMADNGDGTKSLVITLTGEQQEYLNNDITANTQLSITGTAKVYHDLTSRDSNITLTYSNEKAITYDNGGVYNVPVKITAPYGFIMTTSAENIVSKNKELNELKLRANTSSQTVHIKESVTNNFDGEINNFELTGMLPRKDQQYTLGDNNINSNFDAGISGNVYINRNDAKIYYSEDNQTWSETKTENSNLFKITLDNANLNKGENITLEYDLKVPENLSYSKSSYVAFIANAKQNENNVNNWSGMKVSTEDMKLVNEDPKTSTIDEDQIKTEIAVMKGNVSLQDGDSVNNEQNLKYTIKLTNTTNERLTNIKVTATNTNAVFYEYTSQKVTEELMNEGFYEVPEKKQEDFMIDSLEPGASTEVSYQVVVKKSGDNSTTQATLKVSADSIPEKEIKSIENPIVDGKLKLTLDPATTFGYQDGLTERSSVSFRIGMKNLTQEVMNDITINLYYTQYINFTSNYIETESGDRAEIIDNSDNTLKIKVDNLQPGEELNMYVYGIFNTIADDSDTKSFYTFCNTVYDDVEYLSGQLEFKIRRILTDFSLVQSSNIEGEVSQGDNLIYTTDITNTGNKEGTVSIYDTVPENAVINNVYLEQNGQRSEIDFAGQTISTNCDMQAGEKVTLIIDTTINTYLNNNKEIENTVSLNSSAVSEVKKSNTIKHQIIDELGDVNTDNPDNPGGNNPGGNTPGGNNPGGETPSTSNREINGFVWNDTNKDGIKDSSESNLSSIRVLLITSAGDIVKETTSTANGYYEFSNISQGTYRVVFEYDTSKYYLSPYKVNGVAEDKNSDVMEAEIEENGQSKQVAATEDLNLADENLNNVNAGFIEVSKRGLSITKTITKVAVSTNKSTKSYDFNRKQIAKVEIPSKEIPNAQIAIEYTIDIQNTGETSETIKEILDTPSADLNLNDSSGAWYKKDKQIITNQLEGTSIAPGETKTLKLVMTTTTGSAGEGKNVTNKADISNVQSSNENIKIDINNTNSTAQLIIGIKTGALQITIAVIIILAVLITIVTIIIMKKRGGLRKNEK